MKNENQEKPLTLSRLGQFYQEVMRPETERMISERLVGFYHKVMRPELERMIDVKMDERLTPLRMEMLQGFDDLYKKFETLDMEYVAVKHGLKRLEEDMSEVKDRLSGVERKLSH